MKSQLEQLKQFSTISCDTGDFSLIKKYAPTDATTNPSLILQAIKNPQYQELLESAIYSGLKENLNEESTIAYILDQLTVNFGIEILKLISGRVSTEIDARFSFNVLATVQRARNIVSLYEKAGIKRERILVKIASTWEGIQAAEILEKEGIHCNLTLLFGLIQAIAAANAKVTLISPFVGRILDWWKAHGEKKEFSIEEDPGVASVKQIYSYYKKINCQTQIMAASFRSIDQVIALSGCDLLTISPKLLDQLQISNAPLNKALDPNMSKDLNVEATTINESVFRYLLNDNPMATEKLSEGIRLFSKDTIELENIVISVISKMGETI